MDSRHDEAAGMLKHGNFVVSIALFLYALPTWAASPCDRPLTVGWDDFAPYYFSGSDGKPKGYAVVLLEKAAAELGCPLQYKREPWVRTLAEVQAGTTDVGMEAVKTPEREAFCCYARGYSPEVVKLWARRDQLAHWPVHTLDDFKKLGKVRIGLTRGDRFGDELDDWLKHPPQEVILDIASDYKTNFKKLQLERIDLLLAPQEPAEEALAKLPEKVDVATLDVFWLAGSGGYIFSKKSVSPAVCQAFNMQLDKLWQGGSIQQLYRQYMGKEYPRPCCGP